MSVEAKSWVRAGRARRRGDMGEVALLAFPVVLQTVAETVMQLANSAMVGRLGAAQLGAVGFASIWMWTLFVPFAGTANGVQAFVSRQDGAGDSGGCGAWVWQAIWALVPAMLAWACILVWLVPVLFAAVGPSPELLEAAVRYGEWRLLSAPFIAANFALFAFFRGCGDTRTPMFTAMVAICANVFAAWVLVFGRFGLPQLGAAGAGAAMAIGSATNCVLLTIAFLRQPMRARYGTGSWRPRRAAIARLLRTGAPIGGQWLLDMVTFAVFTSIVARMGAASMAASQAMLQLLALSFMQAMAISQASGTLVGRYLGAGDPEAAQRSYASAQLLSLGVSAIVALLFVAIPEQLLAIFSDDPEVLALARPLLALGAFFQLIDAVGIVASGSLRGAGDTRWPFAVQATLAWALRLPIVYVCAVVLGGGVFGAWAAELVHIGALSLALALRFRSGRWRSIAI